MQKLSEYVTLYKNNPFKLYMMHTDWINYLQTLHLTSHTPQDQQAILAPLTHLAVLEVSGNDAARFLQGQTTCDVNALVDAEPRIGAYCNAKGRAITTFIIIKQGDSFLLILTSELNDSVRKKLMMYVLRSDVQISDQTEHLCIVGIRNMKPASLDNIYLYPQLNHGALFIGTPEQATSFCSQMIAASNITLVDSNVWLGVDIQAGIPWLFQATSEDFVPQMLNLDKLDAISFDKGCYTGQEIVARTHYLGKNKRAMYQASCATEDSITPGCTISAAEDEASQLGTVILASKQASANLLLVVLKDQANDAKNLQLNNENHDKISLTSC